MSGIILTKDQQIELDQLVEFCNSSTEFEICVLEGYAGTGKTTLIAKLLMSMDKKKKIAIAAPTNKAVAVLRDKIQDTAELFDSESYSLPRIAYGSIHSFLGLGLNERDDGSQECRKERESKLHFFDVVVVDECSMIGKELFDAIILQRRGALIIFVGDPAQLPPISQDENISKCFSVVQCKYRLNEIVRQSLDNPIISLSIVIRNAIEKNERVRLSDMVQAIDKDSKHVAIISGDEKKIASIALYELKHGSDARIIAFTNKAVTKYNRIIHEELFGFTDEPFSVNEKVIIHTQSEAFSEDDGISVKLITSEELLVKKIRRDEHPMFGDIPSFEVSLERDNGDIVSGYVPQNRAYLDNVIGEKFAEWRNYKSQAQLARGNAQYEESERLSILAKKASKKAWTIKKSFIDLRHAYAITAHKSQGSTFDTSIIDLANLARMRSAFAFNRALYVSVTRASKRLAIIC